MLMMITIVEVSDIEEENSQQTFQGPLKHPRMSQVPHHSDTCLPLVERDKCWEWSGVKSGVATSIFLRHHTPSMTIVPTLAARRSRLWVSLA